MRKNTVLDGGYLLRKRSSRISQDFPSREDLKRKIQKGRERRGGGGRSINRYTCIAHSRSREKRDTLTPDCRTFFHGKKEGFVISAVISRLRHVLEFFPFLFYTQNALDLSFSSMLPIFSSTSLAKRNIFVDKRYQIEQIYGNRIVAQRKNYAFKVSSCFYSKLDRFSVCFSVALRNRGIVRNVASFARLSSPLVNRHDNAVLALHIYIRILSGSSLNALLSSRFGSATKLAND